MLDFWIAFDAIEPIGDQWEQTAGIRESLAAIYGILAWQNDRSADVATAMDFMPTRYRRPDKDIEPDEPAPAVMDPIEEFKMVGRMFGFKEEQLQVKGK